jgi:hypothetical protein
MLEYYRRRPNKDLKICILRTFLVEELLVTHKEQVHLSLHNKKEDISQVISQRKNLFLKFQTLPPPIMGTQPALGQLISHQTWPCCKAIVANQLIIKGTVSELVRHQAIKKPILITVLEQGVNLYQANSIFSSQPMIFKTINR